jgi:hypothetical protein
MEEILLDNCLSINFEDDAELFDNLLEISDITKSKFAEDFDMTLDGVSHWTRKNGNVPVWAIKYLQDTLELQLRMMGYMLKLKKAPFVMHEIKKAQDDLSNLRIDIDGVPPAPVVLKIGDLITEDKSINTVIISNISNMINTFISKHTPKQ